MKGNTTKRRPARSTYLLPPSLRYLSKCDSSNAGNGLNDTSTNIRHCIEQIIEMPLQYICHPDFDHWVGDKVAEADILAPLSADMEQQTSQAPSDTTPFLAALYKIPLLTREGEVHLFRKMNYMRHLARRLQLGLIKQPTHTIRTRSLVTPVQNFNRLLNGSEYIRNELLQRNLRLVVSMARHYMIKWEKAWDDHDIEDLLSDGTVAMRRSVNYFDYGKGLKFSTYATWAIKHEWQKTISTRLKHNNFQRTNFDDELDVIDQTSSWAREQQAILARRALKLLLERVNARDQEFIKRLYGLFGAPGEKLEDIGDDPQYDLTKEAVRVSKNKAIAELQEYVRARFDGNLDRFLESLSSDQAASSP